MILNSTGQDFNNFFDACSWSDVTEYLRDLCCSGVTFQLRGSYCCVDNITLKINNLITFLHWLLLSNGLNI